jgi:hypothetical protein
MMLPYRRFGFGTATLAVHDDFRRLWTALLKVSRGQQTNSTLFICCAWETPNRNAKSRLNRCLTIKLLWYSLKPFSLGGRRILRGFGAMGENGLALIMVL